MNFFNLKVLLHYGIALVAILFVTVISESMPMRISPTTIALVFLLIILFTASFAGRNSALLASLAAILSFNYFFLPPYRTWNISDSTNWVAWFAFMLTAIIAGELSAYANRRAEEAERGKIQIERLYHELQDAFEQASQTEALRQSEQLKSSLLDAVTHDLRTPLTSIKASVTTLLEDKKERLLDYADEHEFLEIINEETDRLNAFIEGIVGIAKIEANALYLRKNWSASEEIINNAINRLPKLPFSHKILIEIERDLPTIFVDAHSVSEVVYTLLDNAAKYSPKKTKIRITARATKNEMVEIGIENEGKGIEKKMRVKIFEKFFRVSDGDIHNNENGLGLGLAIARGIIESQNGKIWIEDGRDSFVTRFVFQLPIGDPETVETKN